MRQDELFIKADTLDYTEADTTVVGRGDVLIDKAGDQALGPFLRFNIETQEGYMETPNFSFAKKLQRPRASRGSASRLQFEGPDVDRLFDARYTTCSAGNDDWYLRASELELDRRVQIGVATHASVVFKGVPILYLPFLDFPLNNQRKSGFLTPLLGTSGGNGLILEVPYYWNIAPNYDATITPRLLTKRGLQLNNEFRYLQKDWLGQIDAEYLPNDNVKGIDRYFGRLQHRHALLPNLSLALDLQKASDDDYFRDLSTKIASTSQVLLPRDGLLTYNFATYWTASARVLRYQVLQDALNSISPPYQLSPQLTLAGNRNAYHGANVALFSESTDFHHPNQINARRIIVNPSVSYPLTRSYGYVTPKLSYHATRYLFGDNNNAGLPNVTRNLPTGSLDSGLFLERDTKLGSTVYRHTVEPRVFYAYTPYRDQSRIPNFSTSELDFGFAQIFSENPFIGGDRIADANHITFGATSRLINTDSGIERIRAVLAQRFHFTPPRVTLSGTPSGDRRSDVLAELSGQITDHWTLDSSIQYNADQSRTERYLIGARYRPGPGKILNLGYRFTRDSLRQVDVSTQWPIAANWQGLARVNYSLQDKRVLEGLVGLEYNRDCWALRLVAHRFPIAEQRTTTSFFIQLELKGLSAIGLNPLETLKQNIPGYTKNSETAL
ncbi:MAG: LPS-assembly protein LptD [Burkholderiales bacterium]|nr:LPS-assembly protein LptD [Burkholderiales bacterium]